MLYQVWCFYQKVNDYVDFHCHYSVISQLSAHESPNFVTSGRSIVQIETLLYHQKRLERFYKIV